MTDSGTALVGRQVGISIFLLGAFGRPITLECSRGRFKKGSEKLAFIGADFCLLRANDARPKIYYSGQGKIYKGVLDKLTVETRNIKDEHPECAVIWVIHFPPFGACKQKFALNDYEQLLEAAKEQQITLLLSGHLHQVRVYRVEDGIDLLMAGSACALERSGNNWVHFIEIEIDGGIIRNIQRTDFCYDDDDNAFARHGVVRI